MSHLCVSVPWSEFTVMLATLDADICFQLVRASDCSYTHLGYPCIHLTNCLFARCNQYRKLHLFIGVPNGNGLAEVPSLHKTTFVDIIYVEHSL